MFVDDFYSKTNNKYVFSKQQGSDFAKQVAGDFNPLHDADNSRFCVPGDLLFSLTVSQFGLSEEMTFDFQGMIGGNDEIDLVVSENEIVAKDQDDKVCLTINRRGEVTQNPLFLESFIKAYVAFSGKTFPHILIDLMKQEGVMVNTSRPMVIYDQMKVHFDQFVDIEAEVKAKSVKFDVTGKRGTVTMKFDLCADGQSIGHGEKQIIMSGLRPYDQGSIDNLVDAYNQKRNAYEMSL
ncbi:MAG: DUF3581 domain-containing protein [Gammaproteobacteria bacterium]|nr:DUF3581 domain-containing protein [Gammaproteobacteria bacterium]MDH5630871.1 DUF3581 domain-containing protein [Gammaproteobacteria bacterium]